MGTKQRSNPQKKEKREWAIENIKARYCRKTERHLFLSIAKMESLKSPSKTEEKLEVPMEAATCKMVTRKRLRKLRSAVASENTNPRKKTKYACIVEAHESRRKSLEYTLPRNHEDHITEKMFNSTNHCNLVHTFIPMPQAMKIPDAKAAVDKEWEMLEKISAR